MIIGEYNQRDQVIVSLELRSSSGRTTTIQAVLDTGFTGFLMLPESVVLALQLPLIEQVEVVLADGSLASLLSYEIDVLWEQERTVIAYASHGDPLIGMALLREMLVTMELTQDGNITIEPL